METMFAVDGLYSVAVNVEVFVVHLQEQPLMRYKLYSLLVMTVLYCFTVYHIFYS